MKQVIFLLFFLNAFQSLPAQDGFTDQAALAIPKDRSTSIAGIAEFMNASFKNDRQKLRGIYRWITYNIHYDTDSMYVFNWGKDPVTKAGAALRRRKGVCENFSALMNELCNACGVHTYIVNGYTKQDGRVNKSGHSWCAVKLQGSWYFCDPTWDAGYKGSTSWFLVEPAEFIDTHMPFDPIWQALAHTVSYETFINGDPNIRGNSVTGYNNDSLEKYLALNPLSQLQSAADRIRRAGLPNELTRNNLSFVEMQIGLIFEDADAANYQNAVWYYNLAVSQFNEFILFRNNAFLPERANAELRAMLVPVMDNIARSNGLLDLLERSAYNVQYNGETLRASLRALTIKTKEQQNFIERYLGTDAGSRRKLFS